MLFISRTAKGRTKNERQKMADGLQSHLQDLGIPAQVYYLQRKAHCLLVDCQKSSDTGRLPLMWHGLTVVSDCDIEMKDQKPVRAM